jgi:hypothetical protein
MVSKRNEKHTYRIFSKWRPRTLHGEGVVWITPDQVPAISANLDACKAIAASQATVPWCRVPRPLSWLCCCDEDRSDLAVPRPAVIPLGSWPRRMPAELAADYCGEPTVEAFMSRVGREYPRPRVNDERRRLWLRDDLDLAILPPDLQRVRDVAEDL